MILVLLPGMDGTTLLFEDFIEHCNSRCLKIPLPQDCKQTHLELSEQIIKRLPDEDYVLLAESFSVGLIPNIIQSVSRRPKAIVLVAGFLQSPRPLIISLLCKLPISALTKLLLLKSLANYFCMNSLDKLQFDRFWKLVLKLDLSILRDRLKEINRMKSPVYQIDIPTLSVVAKKDRLIPKPISKKLERVFSKISVRNIDGPHFILQVESKATADAVNQFVAGIEQNHHA